MTEGLIAHLDRLGIDPATVCFESVWWSPALAQREEDLIRRLGARNRLDWMSLRRFVVHSLADALAYQDVARSPGQLDVYDEVHAVIREGVARLRRRVREGVPEEAPEVPLAVVAHSLGCHMMSNYIWDARAAASSGSGEPANAFEAFGTLALMVTLGCNIPLFTLAYQSLTPIDVPGADVLSAFPPGTRPTDVAAACRWLNFYDPDDVLGYPLKPLSSTYGEAVSADITVNVGGLLSSWNPRSHTAYWTDDDVISNVARALSEILELL
jgi:hypothetical protein